MPLSRSRAFSLIACSLLAWSSLAAADDALVAAEPAMTGDLLMAADEPVVASPETAPAPAMPSDLTPRPQRVFTEKPRIEDYTDYGTFLVDIMEYRRQKEEAAARAAAQAAMPAPAAPAADSGTDPALYRINGPESLDDALARAKKLPHPVYQEAERYGRTTANSFPIQSLDSEDMSSNEVSGQLADLETLEPDVYREQDAIEENVVVSQARKPTNDSDARDKKADEDSDVNYRPTYDRENRIASDSDGNTYRVPLYIKNEVNYTVIRRAEFTAEVIKRN